MLGRGGPLSLQELCFQYVEAALLRNTLVSDVFCGLAHHVGKRWPSFIARAVLSVRRSRTIATHSGFRGFLWVGSSCWEEVALFHCKSCAFSTSKPHYCETHWFQMFFVGWLIMLGRGGPLSLQELCFQYVEAALLRHTVVSEGFCGLAHHVGKRWLSFIARAVLSVGRSRTIAKHTGFRGVLDHDDGKRCLFIVIWGVSLIGGVVWGFGCGFGWGVRGGVAHCVFDSGKPLPGPVCGSIKPFLAI